MPMRSQDQSAAMHAAAAGRSTLGIPRSVGQKFVAESHGQNVKALPKHKARRTIRSAYAKRHPPLD